MVPDSIILTLEVVILGVQSELVYIKHLLTWTQTTTFEAFQGS